MLRKIEDYILREISFHDLFEFKSIFIWKFMQGFALNRTQ